MTEQERIRLRPHHHLFGQGAVAVTAFMVPVFIVLYILTVPDGPWQAVLCAHLFATIVVLVGATFFFRTAIWVDRTGITEVGFFGHRTRVEADEIGSIFVAEVFEGPGTETLPQLFVRDRQGRQLIRMRGQFWSRESMETVLTTLEVPQEARTDSVSTRELGDEYPGLLYWFERRPVIAALAFTAATAVVGVVVFSLLALVGIT